MPLVRVSTIQIPRWEVATQPLLYYWTFCKEDVLYLFLWKLWDPRNFMDLKCITWLVWASFLHSNCSKSIQNQGIAHMQPEIPGNLGTPPISDFQVQDQLSCMNGWLGLVFVGIAELNLTPWLNFKSSFLTWSIELKYLVVLRKKLTYKRSQWWYQLNFLSPK